MSIGFVESIFLMTFTSFCVNMSHIVNIIVLNLEENNVVRIRNLEYMIKHEVNLFMRTFGQCP